MSDRMTDAQKRAVEAARRRNIDQTECCHLCAMRIENNKRGYYIIRCANKFDAREVEERLFTHLRELGWKSVEDQPE